MMKDFLAFRCLHVDKDICVKNFNIFLFVLITLSLGSMSCGTRLPNEVSEVIFTGSRFAKPIEINPGSEDGTKALEYAKQHIVDNSLLGRIVMTSYRNSDKKLVSFLVEHGYSKVECVPLITRHGKEMNCYLVHTDAREKLSRVAERKLVKTTYTNKYESSILGTPVTIYAVTFEYKLNVLVKDFPAVDEIFDGQAQAVLNPSTGKWELGDISLSDKDSRYFTDYIHSNYEPYVPDYKRKAIEGLRKIITDDKPLTGAQEVGQQSYPCRIKFISFDPETGSVTAENRWQDVKTGKFDKTYKVTGKVTSEGEMLTLTETVITQTENPQKITLHYTLRLDEAEGKLSGQWNGPDGRGDIWFSVE